MSSLADRSRIHDLEYEIAVRMTNGSLELAAVEAALQALIMSASPRTIDPVWWRTPSAQMARARELWPGIQLPEPPADFVPLTATEVLLLHVPRPFWELWDMYAPPHDVRKGRSEFERRTLGNYPDGTFFELALQGRDYIEPTWLGFDYGFGHGKPVSSFEGRRDLASSEVLSALLQFPNWFLEWSNESSAPRMGGYRIGRRTGSWRDVEYYGTPALTYYAPTTGNPQVYPGRLELFLQGVDVAHPHFNVPRVRKC